MKLPRTRRGWIRLFWIMLRRCDVCHGPTCRDPWMYDNGMRYCFACDGIHYQPGGVFMALRMNDSHEPKEKQDGE